MARLMPSVAAMIGTYSPLSRIRRAAADLSAPSFFGLPMNMSRALRAPRDAARRATAAGRRCR
ncbi:hypothetical protein [Mycobacterium persicum]|uniref:Uncharacterized protein n=1 Tax=Mycobacterium persicum TaxID=1487726 RepID=A0A8E2LL24_9MYCO|nr:hypothetical protein [Mycobacterium persicum]KZS86061.1 hypothetical protein A4G31_03065 [Mycobacterium persicum]ORB51423.1 hypothetical protein BST40_10455 [Mycobacterium persicum]ORC05841.1 hypothetical protein B4U45_03380 [Mycobacterium persicum]